MDAERDYDTPGRLILDDGCLFLIYRPSARETMAVGHWYSCVHSPVATWGPDTGQPRKYMRDRQVVEIEEGLYNGHHLCPDCGGNRVISLGEGVRGFKICMNEVHFPLLHVLGPAQYNRCGHIVEGEQCQSDPTYHVFYPSFTNVAMCDAHFVQSRRSEEPGWWGFHAYDPATCGTQGR